MRLFDTHCHLNLKDSFPNPEEDIEKAFAAGVSWLTVVGIDMETSRTAVQIAEDWHGVFATVGVHPNQLDDWNRDAAAELCELCHHPKVVAWGEIGLDYHWMTSPPERQRECLMEQVRLAVTCEMPVVIHCRDAYPDLIRMMESCEDCPPALFHCFSGSAQDAERALAEGAILGFDGPLTYKRNEGLREMVAGLPRDRVVLETDSPFLSPEPFRGKPNSPASLALVNQKLAQLWEMDPEESAKQTTENAMRFFRLEAVSERPAVG